MEGVAYALFDSFSVGEVIDRHGRLDILVNNAGITIDKQWPR